MPPGSGQEAKMLSEELSRLIGRVSEPVVWEVDRGAIKRFADAVGDCNPLFWDEDYARGTRYCGVVAPPGFFGWPFDWEVMPAVDALRGELRDAMVKAGYPRGLDGGMEYDFSLPVRAGDMLVATGRVIAVQERVGKTGRLVFGTVETTYINRHGNLVARARKTSVGLQ
ncbi:MAG: MaoC family dehydratase N-terminal domain-containing protein [Chloroflexota bacterium]